MNSLTSLYPDGFDKVRRTLSATEDGSAPYAENLAAHGWSLPDGTIGLVVVVPVALHSLIVE